MKKNQLVLAALHLCTFMALLSGCDMSNNPISSSVESIEADITNIFKSNEDVILEGFQETMNEDPEYSKYNIIANEVTLVKKLGNEYNGLIEIEYKGKTRNISITATIDGENILYETKPGELAFLAFEELEQDIKNLWNQDMD